MKNYDELIDGLKKDVKVPEKVMKQFEQTLDSLPDKNKRLRRKLKWPSAVAAAAVLVCTMSVGVYAATKLYEHVIEENNEDGVDVEFNKVTDEYIPPITITPEYLPEGYKEWEEGHYSKNGEWGSDGLTIADAGWLKNFSIPNVSDYEQKQIGNAAALWTYTEGADYPYHVLLFYEADGHAIEIYGSSDISEDDMMKVCENITYVESPEKDPNRTYQAFSEDRLTQAKGEATDTADNKTQEFAAEGLTAIGDEISLTSTAISVGENGNIYVKDIHITDEVNTALINEDTVYDHERVMSCIENNKLKPYTRIVTEWIGDKYVERELGTVNMKNVEVTLEVKNHTEINYDEVNVQPSWEVLKKTNSGNYVISYEIPGYAMEDGFFRSNAYDISGDRSAYYFDSSSFPQDPHFFNMALKGGETKEVHLWFAIPEDMLEDSYLVFHGDSEEPQFVKMMQ